MDALITSLKEKLPNSLQADHTRLEKDRLCETCQRFLKRSKLLRLQFDCQFISDSETLEHSTVRDLIRSARAGCHLCNLIFAEIEGEGRPERTSLPNKFVIEIKLTQRTGKVHMGIEVLRLPAQRIEDRGYSYGGLFITLQPIPCQRVERDLASISHAEEQEGESILTTTRMLSSLHKTTSSVSSKDLARSWLSRCLTHHEQCSSVDAFDRMLPSRLLHIKQSTDSVKVQLTLRSEIPEHAHYITLSHCWGCIQPLRLTTESIDRLRHGIDIYELPKTFYDAISVTMSLNCEYLWIDSLCIIQDSLEDWVQESATMGSVYQNSLCTIAALWARNCEEGLFCFRRESPLALHSCMYNLDGDKNLHIQRRVGLRVPDYILQGKDAAPLNQRAWVIQERILARRTLFFGSSMISWECFETSTCEFPHAFPSYDMSEFRANAKRARSALAATSFAREIGWGQLDSWFRLVGDYSGSGLTRSDDKLVAISGLIKLIEVQSGKTNIAGLWKEAIVACLLWTPTPSFGSRLISGFPSWSWASIEGAVTYDGLYGNKLELQTFEDAMHTDWEVDVIEASSMNLTLHGFLLRAEEVRGWSRVSTTGPEDLDGQRGGLLYDLDEHDEDASWCIPLLSRCSGDTRDFVNSGNHYPEWWVAGLVVQAWDASETRWIRCGLFDTRITGYRTTPKFRVWMASRHHEKQLIYLL
jgi:hypothetical protein